MAIANGETVGVLAEVDPQQTREQGVERQAAEKQKRRTRLAAALARMLKEKRPRSVNAAAQWLLVHAPELYVGQSGEPLGEQSVRKKLPIEIGDGLPAPDAPQQRIVWRPSGRKGASSEIDFEQARLPLPDTPQPRDVPSRVK